MAALLVAVPPARSDETRAAEETPAAAAKSADDSTAAVAKAGADDKFVLPPGFKPKKRGKFTLYCRREQVLGSRFPAERCYDEEGIRAMVQSLREEREKVDQMRRICGNMEACGGGG